MNTAFWQLLLAAEASPIKGRALVEAFDPFSPIDREAFAASPLLSTAEAARVRACDPGAADAAGAAVLGMDARPELLRRDPEAPQALFVLGEPDCLHADCVAIVGTRNAGAYGKAVARKFAGALARAGVTVVSGGAVGIDAAAHEGALAEGGRTAAVLAGGVDKPYPSQNIGLFRRMRANGCQISAYACGTMADRHKFLERNGVIAALSRAVIVVEAPERSGALTTATAAQRLGRPVFAVPAGIDLPSFRGSHALIRSGATLADDPDQVLSALGIEAHRPAVAAVPATGLAARVLAAMGTTPLPAEKLAELVAVSPQELLAELTMLELDGRVIRDHGGYALVP